MSVRLNSRTVCGSSLIAVAGMALGLQSPAQAATITSAPFTFGYGSYNFSLANTWTDTENTAITSTNTPNTQGNFKMTPVPTGPVFTGSGPGFPNRDLVDEGLFEGRNYNMSGHTGTSTEAPNGLIVPITASYNGPAPVDAALVPDYKLRIEITQISIYGKAHPSSSVTTLGWQEVGGVAGSSPNIPLNVNANYGDSDDYTQLVWDPADSDVPLGSLNASQLRTFGISNRLTAGDLRYVDGIEVMGRVHLVYNVIPEPSTTALVGLGALGFAGRRSRK